MSKEVQGSDVTREGLIDNLKVHGFYLQVCFIRSTIVDFLEYICTCIYNYI